MVGYCNDIKPAIVNMDEFHIVDKAASMFEGAGGCRLHRDPSSDKCKILALGGWKNDLRKEDIPLPFLHLSGHLDMLGVKLTANFQDTRRINGETLVEIIKSKTDE